LVAQSPTQAFILSTKIEKHMSKLSVSIGTSSEDFEFARTVPLGIYRQSYLGPIVTWSLMIVAILSIFLPMYPFYPGLVAVLQRIFGIDHNSAVGVANVVPFVLCILAIYLFFKRPYIPGYPNRVVTIYEDGFTLKDGKQTVPYRWQDVEEYAHDVAVHHASGGTIGSQYFLRLKMKDGTAFLFSNSYENVDDLAQHLRSLTSAARVPQMLKQIKSGETLTIDSVLINAVGLQNGKKMASWADVLGTSLDDDVILIKVREADGKTGSIGGARISQPNAFLLIPIVRALAPQTDHQ
jgi:hypothetical protein